MRSAFRVVFLLLALLANEAFAQQSVVFSVDGWPRMSTRDDGKIPAIAFSWGVSMPATGAGAGRPALQDGILTLPIGDPVVLFTQTALRGTRLPRLLVEFPLAKAQPGGAAPFAARFSEVFVTSVTVSKSGNDGGSGMAEVKFVAGGVELFTSVQDPKTGAVRPGAKMGYDAKAGRVF